MSDLKRPGKGKSIIAFPNDFCVVDLETTGLMPEWDEIIEIGAIKVINGQEVERFQTFVKPEYEIPEFITELTGITNEMVADAPGPGYALPTFLEFLGDLPIVGYNVGFDVRFLYDYLYSMGLVLSNNYIDCMRMARKLHPEMDHHRLMDMRELYKVNTQAHRAIGDCEATAVCLAMFKEEGLEQFGSLDAFVNAFKWKDVRAADIIGDPSKANPDSPIYGKHCVFTGKLEKFTRAQAMQLVADHGGINDSSVGKKTNFLVLGNNDYCTTIKDGKSSKQKKAEELKLAGHDIEILPETVFYEMIEE